MYHSKSSGVKKNGPATELVDTIALPGAGRTSNPLFIQEFDMKNAVWTLAISILLPFGGMAFAQDVGKLVEAVDQDKAVESVDTEKMTEAVSSGDVDYEKAYDAVDKEKAAGSVDMDKVKEAMGSPQ
jgi:hypothetical protein